MTLVLVDRVKVRSRFVGTDPIIIENTFPGFQNFNTVGDGNETYYGVFDNVGNWEIGRGTFDQTSQTITRDSIVSSSNNNEHVIFPPGGKTVYSTLPSSVVNRIAANTLTDSFKYISVPGQETLIADSERDTLTVTPGRGIEIVTNKFNDSISIGMVSRYTGSVVGEDRTLLVDGINSKIVGPVDTSTISSTDNPLTVSADGKISVYSSYPVELHGSSVLVKGESGVSIEVYPNDSTLSETASWKFHPDGTLEFPDGSVQKTGFSSVFDMSAAGNFIGSFTGNFMGADSSVIVNSETMHHYGVFVGSLKDEAGNTVVDAETSSVSGNLKGTFNGIITDTNNTVMLNSTTGRHYGYLEGDVIGSVFALNGNRAFDANSGKVVADVISNVVHADGTMLVNTTTKSVLANVVSRSGTTIVNTQSNAVSCSTVSASQALELPVFNTTVDRDQALPTPRRGTIVLVGNTVQVFTNQWISI